MSETWLLVQSGAGEPAWNMAVDEALLENSPKIAKPILRFYSWNEPAATFGYSQCLSGIARVTHLRPLIRRPTGGGLVPHDADWTYTLIFPPNHSWYALKAIESYERIHEWIRGAFQKIGVATELSPCSKKEVPGQCFIGAEKSDVLWCGKKIAGAAQRRTKSGLLIQGSVQPPPISLAKADWQKAMCDVAHENFGMAWNEFVPETYLTERAATLAKEKYSQTAYNQKR